MRKGKVLQGYEAKYGKVSRGALGDRQGINPDLGPCHENVQKQGCNGCAKTSKVISSYDGRSKASSSYDGRSKGAPAFVHRTGTSSYDGVCDGSPTSKPHLLLAGW